MHATLETNRVESIEIQVRGRSVTVPSVYICGRRIVATGKWLTRAAVMDEELVNGDLVSDPAKLVEQLRSSGLKSDLFIFTEKVPNTVPRYSHVLEWENAAVVPVMTFADWWDNRIEYDVRKSVKRSQRVGVVVRTATFDDKFVEGIKGIYNDTPIRQGKAFWHYQKSFDEVKRDNATYLDRSIFIGAYFEEELIGFIKMVLVDNIATTLQVISQRRHFDKKPMSALLAKAVEICAERGLSHLAYGSYIYNDPKSSLTEFKRRHGFEKMMLPRYYLPVSHKGRLALRLGLHRPIAEHVPMPVLAGIKKVREAWDSYRAQYTLNRT